MACPETGAGSGVSYGVQTNFTTPFTGTFKEIPVTAFGLELSKETLQSNAITNTVEVERHGNRQVGGDIGFELAADTFDDFLEGGMMGTWDDSPVSLPDQLIVGKAPKYFTFQDAASTIGQYRLYNGCVVSSWSLTIAPNDIVAPSFTFMGRDGSVSSSTVTTTPYTKNAPFDSYSGELLLGDSGGSLAAGQVTQIKFTVDHGLEQAFIVGSPISACIPKAQTTVSGTFTLHYIDDDAITRFIDEVESAVDVAVNDPSGTNEYRFTFPRIKVNSAGTPFGGQGMRFVEVAFTALHDDTTGTPLLIERPDTNP